MGEKCQGCPRFSSFTSETGRGSLTFISLEERVNEVAFRYVEFKEQVNNHPWPVALHQIKSGHAELEIGRPPGHLPQAAREEGARRPGALERKEEG